MQTLKNIYCLFVYPVYSLLMPGKDAIFFKRSRGSWWAKRPSGIWCQVDKPRPYLLSEYLRYFSLKSGDIVFDVGGELGKETKEFSDLVGAEGKVYSFECFPEHIAHLEKLADAEGNIQVVPKACWNVPKRMTLYKGFTPGSNTLVKNATGQRQQALANLEEQSFIVAADTLDNMWSELVGGHSIDLLKMDIEGAEIEALEGAKQLLEYTSAVAIAAYHHRNNAITAYRVIEILKSANFTNVKHDKNNHVYAWR